MTIGHFVAIDSIAGIKGHTVVVKGQPEQAIAKNIIERHKATNMVTVASEKLQEPSFNKW